MDLIDNALRTLPRTFRKSEFVIIRSKIVAKLYRCWDLDQILFDSIEIEADADAAAIISVWIAGKKKNRKKGKGGEMAGAWLGDRSRQSLPRGLFLRRAILLCLNEVGDLTQPAIHPPLPPTFIVHRRQFRSIGSSFLQFRLEELVLTPGRRSSQYRPADSFLPGGSRFRSQDFLQS